MSCWLFLHVSLIYLIQYSLKLRLRLKKLKFNFDWFHVSLLGLPTDELPINEHQLAVAEVDGFWVDGRVSGRAGVHHGRQLQGHDSGLEKYPQEQDQTRPRATHRNEKCNFVVIITILFLHICTCVRNIYHLDVPNCILLVYSCFRKT